MNGWSLLKVVVVAVLAVWLLQVVFAHRAAAVFLGTAVAVAVIAVVVEARGRLPGR